MKNGENKDLNNQNVQFWGRIKSQKRAKNELNQLTARTKFYVQEYRDI